MSVSVSVSVSRLVSVSVSRYDFGISRVIGARVGFCFSVNMISLSVAVLVSVSGPASGTCRLPPMAKHHVTSLKILSQNTRFHRSPPALQQVSNHTSPALLSISNPNRPTISKCRAQQFPAAPKILMPLTGESSSDWRRRGSSTFMQVGGWK